ncbi:MAG: helicase, partial [Alphaproteobacteria bacterium]|nr:helicase [Alphaproteobacteria bacterium]
NFVSFTPGTSFDMGHSGGQRREREVLFHLLAPHVERSTPLKNLLQGRVMRKDRWRQGLDAGLPVEPGIQRDFDEAFGRQAGLQQKLHEALDTWFRRYRPHWPEEARWARDELIGKLRRLLAETCIRVLEPDLIILDEFQRFKPLIETREDRRSEAAELAQSLFQAEAHDGRPVPTLLLSATPYKLYTTDAEIEQEDHYEDFLATTRFLFGGRDGDVDNLTQGLARFANALKRATPDDAVSLQAAAGAKSEVENSLRAVMARTERVAASEERDAMLNEPGAKISLKPEDVRQYLAADALFQAVGDRDPMPFWKSAPYLVHFMRGYKFNERLNEAPPSRVASVLQAHEQAFLSAEALQQWSEIDPAHPKMRDMVSDQLDRDIWRLLWVPPTLPYWPLEGPFRDKAGLTKTLMFSAWNVVPDVVSAVLSYEAERRMTGGRMTKRRIGSYLEPAKQQVPLLRLTQSAARIRSRHRLLLLLLPCLPLADRAHPLDAPPGRDRQKFVREAIEALLSASGLPDPQDGPVDDRWEWAAPLLLDPDLRNFLEAWRDDRITAVEGDGTLPKSDLLGAYVDDLLDLRPEELGRRPPDLVDLLTEVALGSPAILALRSLNSSPGLGCLVRRRLAVSIATAFWSLFNQPAVISLLRQLSAGKKASRDDTAYWRLVLEYCRQGNLQAVLDEQWHLLWEQHAWSETADATAIAGECVKTLVKVVHPVRSRVHGRFLKPRNPEHVEPDELRIRTVFALRFGHLRTENEENISEDMVRAAF